MQNRPCSRGCANSRRTSVDSTSANPWAVAYESSTISSPHPAERDRVKALNVIHSSGWSGKGAGQVIKSQWTGRQRHPDGGQQSDDHIEWPDLKHCGHGRWRQISQRHSRLRSVASVNPKMGSLFMFHSRHFWPVCSTPPPARAGRSYTCAGWHWRFWRFPDAPARRSL